MRSSALHPSHDASSVDGPDSSSTRPDSSATRSSEPAYVEAVLGLYLVLGGTSGRVGPSDRRLARILFKRRVPIATIEAALLLGYARRTFRSSDAPPLSPIRSLHYFLPVVEEVLECPLVPGYVEHLKAKLFPTTGIKHPSP